MFEILSEFPPELRPSIVTLSAPLRLMSGKPAVTAAEIVRADPPVGEIVMEVHEPLFNVAPPEGSKIFPDIKMLMLAEVCEVELIMLNTDANVEYCPLPEFAPDRVIAGGKNVKLFIEPVTGNAEDVSATVAGYCVNVPELIETCGGEARS